MTQRLLSSTFVLILFVHTFFSSSDYVHSQGVENSIKTEVSINYRLNASGDLTGEFLYSLNNDSDLAIPVKYFQTWIPFPEITELKVSVDREFMIVSSDRYSDSTRLSSYLDESIIPGNGSLDVIITFKVNGYVEPRPAIIVLPSNVRGTITKELKVFIPIQFGTPLRSTSYDTDTRNNEKIVVFNTIGARSEIIFNEILVYKYDQSNFLSNDTDEQAVYEVSVPNISQRQTLLPGVMSDKPDNFYMDSEGNAFLQFKLQPGERKKILISGYLLVNTNRESDSGANISSLTEEKTFWEYPPDNGSYTNGINWLDLDPDDRSKLINSVANRITEILEPSSQSDKQRVGAKNLPEGYEATQQDYVDLTISYLRSYGVPSLQIIGINDPYNNDGLELDTWVEFWDPDSGWEIIDLFSADRDRNTSFIRNDNGYVTLLRRGIDAMAPVYINYNLENFSLQPTSAGIRPINSIDIVPKPIKINNLQNEITLPILIKNSGNVIINSYKIDLGDDISLTFDDELFPGQEKLLDINLDTARITIDKLESSEIKVTATSLIDNEKTVESNVLPIEVVSFWWWELLTMIVSLIIFTTFCTIILMIPKMFRRRSK